MPIKKSAKKALRQTQKLTQTNKIIKSEINTLKKNLLKAIGDTKEKEAKELLLKLQKKMDKAAQRNIVKKNTVSRTISRLQSKLNTQFPKK